MTETTRTSTFPGSASRLDRLPSVDRLLRSPLLSAQAAVLGRELVLMACREILSETRKVADGALLPREDEFAPRVVERLTQWMRPAPRRVFNLTGTVLHTNLGRASLPTEALDAMAEAAGDCDLEYDLDDGRRGERDKHVEGWLTRLTGAEAAIVVNNNAAAVLLVLNTMALRKEALLSRGELIEIGGSFRMPDIMARAGCRLREVGTTNRTHARDFVDNIGPKTGLVMKVHCSNFEIRGFTASVEEAALARIAHDRQLPFFVDLGSGSLIDLESFGLPHERTPREALADGADLVSFSGDKLLGGPQAGLIVGKRDLIARLRRNPLLRTLRIDKLRLAALGAVLRLYADPERIRERLDTFRILGRTRDEIRARARALAPLLAARLGDAMRVEVVDCESQVGSGALPTSGLPSSALTIRPVAEARSPGTAAARLAQSFRQLPIPVIGRIEKRALILDLRCLEPGAEEAFRAQLSHLIV